MWDWEEWNIEIESINFGRGGGVYIKKFEEKNDFFF